MGLSARNLCAKRDIDTVGGSTYSPTILRRTELSTLCGWGEFPLGIYVFYVGLKLNSPVSDAFISS